MQLDGRLVVRVDLRRLDRAANLVGHRLHLRERAAGEEETRPLASEGACQRAADRPEAP